MGGWWREKSGAAKVLVVLAVLLMLQIGLCVATPALTQRWDMVQQKPAGEGGGTFGLVLWELLFCVANAAAIFIAGVWWLMGAVNGRRKSQERIND
jgi:hypothetical protein